MPTGFHGPLAALRNLSQHALLEFAGAPIIGADDALIGKLSSLLDLGLVQGVIDDAVELLRGGRAGDGARRDYMQRETDAIATEQATFADAIARGADIALLIDALKTPRAPPRSATRKDTSRTGTALVGLTVTLPKVRWKLLLSRALGSPVGNAAKPSCNETWC